MNLEPNSSSAASLEGSAPGAAANSRVAWCLAFSLLAVAWLMMLNQQRLEWTVNPTYGYGWAVPFLGGFLLWERWKSRPNTCRSQAPGLWLLLPAFLLFCYLPFRVVQEANPDWVKINWSIFGVVSGVSLSAIYSLGGLRAVFYCGFPILFCFTALPWPIWIEDGVTKWLMQWNADACVEVLTLAGIPAMAKGNVIQIGVGWVNVEEACSGIRSLQTSFMVSLFFGEFHRLGIFTRGILLASSFAVAFVINFGRTLTLTYLGGQGHDLMEKWHDTVGNIAMVLCLVILWLMAEFFQRRADPQIAQKTPAPSPSRAPFPLWFGAFGLAWLGVCELGTAGWYHYHERQVPPPIVWSVAWPEKSPEYKKGEFGERTRALLKYSEGDTAGWRTEDGNNWQMYYLRWLPGRVSKFLAGGHFPTVCLPASGLKLVEETGMFVCHVGDLAIPFMTYLFDENGRSVYVFHSILEDNQASYEGRIVYRQADSTERLNSVIRGERNLGQRVVGIALRGPRDEIEARESLKLTLNKIVSVTSPTALDVNHLKP